MVDDVLHLQRKRKTLKIFVSVKPKKRKINSVKPKKRKINSVKFHRNFVFCILFFYFISFAQKNTENNTSNKNVTIH